MKPFSFPLVDRAASLVGICCCTAAGLCTWLVVLISWMGSSGLGGCGLMLSLRGGTFGGISAGSEVAEKTWTFGSKVRLRPPFTMLPLNDW